MKFLTRVLPVFMPAGILLIGSAGIYFILNWREEISLDTLADSAFVKYWIVAIVGLVAVFVGGFGIRLGRKVDEQVQDHMSRVMGNIGLRENMVRKHVLKKYNLVLSDVVVEKLARWYGVTVCVEEKHGVFKRKRRTFLSSVFIDFNDNGDLILIDELGREVKPLDDVVEFDSDLLLTV